MISRAVMSAWVRSPLLHAGEQSLDVLLIETEDRGSVKGDLVDELQEGLLDVGEIPVVVQMLGINGGHHRQRGR